MTYYRYRINSSNCIIILIQQYVNYAMNSEYETHNTTNTADDYSEAETYNPKKYNTAEKKNIIGGSFLQPRNYCYSHHEGRWIITKSRRYYTSFKTEAEAKHYVELMRKINWDFSKRYVIREMVLNVY